MKKNAYVPVGALVGLAIGYFLFRDGRGTLAAISLAFIVALVGAIIGYFFAKGASDRR